MNPPARTHKDNPSFCTFGLFVYLSFFIMATCFPVLPLWLPDVLGRNKTLTGLVFTRLPPF
ncbi:MFS transporter, partial [Klebsiella pneumoniae]|uniref:MFS transporter n=1 Tax=Klebsiella pneumoniae TaxID=573 RepID=UPI001F51FAAE